MKMPNTTPVNGSPVANAAAMVARSLFSMIGNLIVLDCKGTTKKNPLLSGSNGLLHRRLSQGSESLPALM